MKYLVGEAATGTGYNAMHSVRQRKATPGTREAGCTSHEREDEARFKVCRPISHSGPVLIPQRGAQGRLPHLNSSSLLWWLLFSSIALSVFVQKLVCIKQHAAGHDPTVPTPGTNVCPSPLLS